MNYLVYFVVFILYFVIFIKSTENNIHDNQYEIKENIPPAQNGTLDNTSILNSENSTPINLELKETHFTANDPSLTDESMTVENENTKNHTEASSSQNNSAAEPVIRSAIPQENLSEVNHIEQNLSTNEILEKSNETVQQETPPRNLNESEPANNFDLTSQMEKTYNQTEYNYNEENSETIGQAENISDNINSHEITEEENEYREWQEKVTDFTVAEMLTVKIKSNQVSFYEEVENVPSVIKVAFFNSDRGEKINFFIFDNSKKAMITDRNKRYGYHEFNATTPGTYKFLLDGSKSKKSKKITFAIHTGNYTDTHLESENIDKISGKLQNVKKRIKEIRTRQNFFNKNIERYFENTQKHNKHIVTMTIVECIMMIVILIVQFVYLKSLLTKF